MLKFDKQDYIRQISTAWDNMEKLQNMAEELSKKEFKRIIFAGTGGTISMPMLVENVFKKYSSLEVDVVIAKELILTDAGRIDPQTLCIFASQSGTTEETLEAAQYCREHGGYCIAFVGASETPFSRWCDEIIYLDADNSTFLEPFTISMLIFAMRYLNGRCKEQKVFEEEQLFLEGLQNLPEALCRVRERFDPIAEEYAKENREETFYMVVGAGNLWGLAYGYAMCVLEEMQWLHTKSIHAAEFFHGTLEIVDENTKMIVFRGEDESQVLCDRVTDFARTITEHILILDTSLYELPGIPKAYRKYLSPLVVEGMLERISAHLEREREHPLDTRRYYRKVNY